MLNQVLVKCIGFVFILKCTEAVRILWYQPIPFESHQKVSNILIEEISRHGHHLVVLTAVPLKEPNENILEIDVHQVSYPKMNEAFDKAAKHRNTYAFPDPLEFIRDLGEGVMIAIVDHQLSHPQMQALIKDETQRFDLIVVESALESIGNMLSARFEAPLLVTSSMSTHSEVFKLVGAETNNYFYPDSMPIIPQEWNLSFWQRLYTFYKYALIEFAYKNVQNAFVKNYMAQQIPPFNMKMGKGVNMLFLNVPHFWDNNRPAPIGSVFYMGGLHLKCPKTLPHDLKLFVDNSKHGTVIINFGSKQKSSEFPARALRRLINVISQLPYDFIWTWDIDGMPNKPNNVRLEKSLPLNDLLHHPKVKAFITHGGLLSTLEAINARVPLIGFPMYGDQWLNTHQYEKHGIGIRLDIDSLDEEDLRNAIVAVVEDKKYRDNIVRLSSIMSDHHQGTLQTASRWAHQLATRGAQAHLRSPLADVTFLEFYMLDLILIAITCVLVTIISTVFAVKRLFKLA